MICILFQLYPSLEYQPQEEANNNNNNNNNNKIIVIPFLNQKTLAQGLKLLTNVPSPVQSRVILQPLTEEDAPY